MMEKIQTKALKLYFLSCSNCMFKCSKDYVDYESKVANKIKNMILIWIWIMFMIVSMIMFMIVNI